MERKIVDKDEIRQFFSICNLFIFGITSRSKELISCNAYNLDPESQIYEERNASKYSISEMFELIKKEYIPYFILNIPDMYAENFSIDSKTKIPILSDFQVGCFNIYFGSLTLEGIKPLLLICEKHPRLFAKNYRYECISQETERWNRFKSANKILLINTSTKENFNTFYDEIIYSLGTVFLNVKCFHTTDKIGNHKILDLLSAEEVQYSTITFETASPIFQNQLVLEEEWRVLDSLKNEETKKAVINHIISNISF